MTLQEHFDNHDGRWIAKVDTYFDDYEVHFAPFRGTAVRILEIGVDWGGSLELWQSYFGKDAIIHGLDINPETASNAPSATTMHIGSQADHSLLASIASEHGPFDIVIDDGSHEVTHQLETFMNLYPTMSDHGVYVCEDAFSSYWSEYGGGYRKEGTFMEYVKDRIDDLYAFWTYDADSEPTEFTRSTAGIHVYSGTVVFKRRPMSEPQYVARKDGQSGTMSALRLRSDWKQKAASGE
jgi:hypothetical protein